MYRSSAEISFLHASDVALTAILRSEGIPPRPVSVREELRGVLIDGRTPARLLELNNHFVGYAIGFLI